MRREWMVGIMAGALLATGCVSNSKYQEAVAEAESMREELVKVREQRIALEQQVRALKELNAKYSSEANAARDELQRLEHSRDKERGRMEGKTSELEEKIRTLSAQNRNLRQELQDVRRHNETLKSMVARYQKELKDRTQMPLVPPQGGSPALSGVAPAVGMVNVNKVSASDLVLLLGVNQEEADRIVNNRPYRVKGELVAKNVLTKDAFDKIKERITVSQ
ncbi:MAG: helix-hairpin-helix domain-containing protein [Nitrospira sp.]|nr:helix-hairpin-helix domain-containing protein [Nitrospira sp.]